MIVSDAILSGVIGLIGSGFGVAIINGIFSKATNKATAKKTVSESEKIDHETWFKEARDLYDEAKKKCKECEDGLRLTKDQHTQDMILMREDHAKEMGKIRRELAEVREALIKRVDAFDEILPYVQNIPDDKMADLRAANRAVKSAIFRVD